MTCYLALPSSFGNIHNIFHVLKLQKYVYDPKHVIHHEEMMLNPDASYLKKPEAISCFSRSIMKAS